MPNQMDKSDAARIQASQAKNGGDMSSRGFAAHAQAAADRNQNSGAGQAQGQGNSGGDSGKK